jgi:SEC-C motif-containing protein
MNICPCGSTIEYASCCGLLIERKQPAPTPEALMRSRFSAYYLKHYSYIMHTMHGKPAYGYDVTRVADEMKGVNWVRLNVLNTSMSSQTSGFVEFIAYFIEHRKLKFIHENSRFSLEEGQWYYVDGTHMNTLGEPQNQVISQNTPCPCGSHKKFKNCHGAS